MKRLTVRNDKNNMACCPKWISCASRCEDCDHFTNMMNKLADYEDLDEHGNVIRDGDELNKKIEKLTEGKVNET